MWCLTLLEHQGHLYHMFQGGVLLLIGCNKTSLNIIEIISVIIVAASQLYGGNKPHKYVKASETFVTALNCSTFGPKSASHHFVVVGVCVYVKDRIRALVKHC